jgi:pyruvate/2-oxoglutarate dehydrogenase complex dihydrolipoamide dehydrogenase (E3) component
VIIGGTAAARHAAIAARSWKARVALVEPDLSEKLGPCAEDVFHYGLIQAAHTLQQTRQGSAFGLHWTNTEEGDRLSIHLNETREWNQQLGDILNASESPALLASQGIDVIWGTGEFGRRPQLAFEVNGRRLRSRRYLIASGSRTVLPNIDGLYQAKPLTPESLWQATDLTKPPANLIVIGSEPVAVEMAQTFAYLGSHVTLIVPHQTLLPHEDADASRLIQTQLEVEGVRVITRTEVSQVKQLDGKKWVQAGNQALETDEIVVAAQQQPQIKGLNLEAAGLLPLPNGLRVNAKLQTSHPRIYAAGGVLGGYPLAHIARYEALIAVRNALFFPFAQVNYRVIPWAVYTKPGLARIGLTEMQARQRYGDRILVHCQFVKRVAKAQVHGETTGFCKLIGRLNGEILGAHVVAPDAEEVMGAIALAMQQNCRIQSLAQVRAISPSYADLIYQTAAGWQQQKRDRNVGLSYLLEDWFSWRRS